MHSVLYSAVLFAGLSSALALPPSAFVKRTTPTITWKNCTASDPARLQCGTMSVPLDPASPNGEKITIGMARLKSTTATPPLGVLLMNPGGPGGVASGVIKQAASGVPIFSTDLQAAYDIIGLDPRGVGLSTPVKCDMAVYNQRVTLFPTTTAEFDALVAYNKALGASCAKLTGNLINHLSTADVVEDLELFRQAVNAGKTGTAAKLNFLAFSYGTQMAVQYAEVYPTNINRFVLDGVVDHTLPEAAALLAEASTLERTLNYFFDWCEAASPSDCPLQGQDLPAFWDNLISSAQANPISASCSSTNCYNAVTGYDIIDGTQGGLIGPDVASVWPQVAAALQAAANGDASAFAVSKATSNSSKVFANIAIGCQDWYHDAASLTDVLAKTRMAEALAPHTKGVSQSYTYQVACIGWPAPLSNPQHCLKSAAQNAPPMLIINSYYDPSTSVSWATNVAASLPKSVFLERNGAGHSSFPLGGDAQKAVDNFLLTGVLPARGTVVNS